MANTREIQSRMKSIEDTMKITNAMYMISSTKLRRAKKELEDTEPYFFTLQGMLARIISATCCSMGLADVAVWVTCPAVLRMMRSLRIITLSPSGTV